MVDVALVDLRLSSLVVVLQESLSIFTTTLSSVVSLTDTELPNLSALELATPGGFASKTLSSKLALGFGG